MVDPEWNEGQGKESMQREQRCVCYSLGDMRSSYTTNTDYRQVKDISCSGVANKMRPKSTSVAWICRVKYLQLFCDSCPAK